MESTFLSKENLDNIYEYLNTKTVRDYNVNLDSNEKYKKIVKKLSKTIFKSLNSKIQNMSSNEFNELVVNKSIPFIKKSIDKDKCKLSGNYDSSLMSNSDNIMANNSSDLFEKPINYSYSELQLDLNKSAKLNGESNNNSKGISKQKKTRINSKRKQKNVEYDSYLKDALEFENLVKQSNNKIKSNFKDLFKKTQNNFIKNCETEDVDPFIMNRCSARDDMIEKGLSKSAFEEIVENKTLHSMNQNRNDILNSMNNLQNNNVNNNVNNNGNNNNRNNINNSNVNNLQSNSNSYPTNNNLNNLENVTTTSVSNGTGAIDYYDNHDINYKKLFTEILVNQKDFSSNNKVDSYEGETYLPNLISNYGEEAPIQPLLYQNTKSGSEILNQYSMIIDTGNTAGGSFAEADNAPDKEYDLTTETYNSVVTLTGIFPWQKFRVDLEDTFQLDKITDVYLKSFSLIGPTSMDKCLFFVLDIEEFNLRSYSNNPHLKSKIVIQNTISGAPTVDTVFTKSYSKHSNYLTTITPSNYTSLNFQLTNENSEGADDGDDKTFNDRTSQKNRVIFELDFVTRRITNPSFNYEVTSDTLESII